MGNRPDIRGGRPKGRPFLLMEQSSFLTLVDSHHLKMSPFANRYEDEEPPTHHQSGPPSVLTNTDCDRTRVGAIGFSAGRDEPLTYCERVSLAARGSLRV